MENRSSDKRSKISLDRVLREVAELENSRGEPDRIWSLSDIDDLLASTDTDSTAPADEDDTELLTSINTMKTDTLTMIRRRSLNPYTLSREPKSPRRRLPPSRNPRFRRSRLRLPQNQKMKNPPNPTMRSRLAKNLTKSRRQKNPQAKYLPQS